MGCKLHYYS